MRELDIIAAIDQRGAIGRQGQLVHRHPQDLKRFRMLTEGCALIMGRKTWESIGSKPLPGRVNIVLSKKVREWWTPERSRGAIIAESIEQAIVIARTERPKLAPMVIGGGWVYHQTLPLARHLWLTHFPVETADADTFFPVYFPEQWREFSRRELADGTVFRGLEFVERAEQTAAAHA